MKNLFTTLVILLTISVNSQTKHFIQKIDKKNKTFSVLEIEGFKDVPENRYDSRNNGYDYKELKTYTKGENKSLNDFYGIKDNFSLVYEFRSARRKSDTIFLETYVFEDKNGNQEFRYVNHRTRKEEKRRTK